MTFVKEKIKQEERFQLISIIRAEQEKLTKKLNELKELTGYVAPDDVIGRISRMDAINNKSIMDAIQFPPQPGGSDGFNSGETHRRTRSANQGNLPDKTDGAVREDKAMIGYCYHHFKQTPPSLNSKLFSKVRRLKKTSLRKTTTKNPFK